VMLLALDSLACVVSLISTLQRDSHTDVVEIRPFTWRVLD
jgi:hypothetical protein